MLLGDASAVVPAVNSGFGNNVSYINMQETDPVIKLSVAEFNEIARQRLPFAAIMGLNLEQITPSGVAMRATYSEAFLRPGGTVSGPVMMTLADAAIYALILSRIGPVELAVTTNLSVNFLRRPKPRDIIAHASILKLGKRLAVAEAKMYSDRDNDMIAHATATYSIPPQES